MADARINIFKTGAVFGIQLGCWHLCWSALVATGWAQRVADFFFGCTSSNPFTSSNPSRYREPSFSFW